MRYLIMFMLFFFCKNDASGQKYKLGEEWINNFKAEGGELFYEFDYCSLKGKNIYKLNEIEDSTTVFGVLKSDDKISIYKISGLKNKIKIEKEFLYKSMGFFVSTEILSEVNLEVFNRIVTVYKDDMIISFNYIVINQQEYLSDVTFKYESKKVNSYVNKEKTYLNYEKILNEKSDLLKSFEIQ